MSKTSAFAPVATAAFLVTSLLVAASSAARAEPVPFDRRPHLERSADAGRDFGPRHRLPQHLRRIEAHGSYGSDYLPFYVQQWRARRAAIEIWNAKVARIYGDAFAHWRTAEGKRVECDADHDYVHCTVSAVPTPRFQRWSWRDYRDLR